MLGDPLVDPDPDGVPIFATGSSTLPGATWAFGGLCYGDGTLESALGRQMLEFEGDPEEVYYLSVTLDTANADVNADTQFPSWGVVNDMSKCRTDWDLDGDVDEDDVYLFVNTYDAGSLVFDFNHDGTVSGADFSSFLSAWNDESVNGCSRRCLGSIGEG